MDQEHLALLREGLHQYGVEPSDVAVRAIAAHLEMVTEWNERVNLTAITNPRDMVLKHVIDSAAVFSVMRPAPGDRVLDVGTGAGFPGVVWKCIEPAIDLVLLESLAKRCRFLEAVGEQVVGSIMEVTSGYKVVWGRAEEKGQERSMRERFDVVTARAVADLRVLAEYCLPFCKVGGEFIAMKGPTGNEELETADLAIRILGGEIKGVHVINLPAGAGGRTVIRVRKVKSTPKAYPRQPGMPVKKPL